MEDKHGKWKRDKRNSERMKSPFCKKMEEHRTNLQRKKEKKKEKIYTKNQIIRKRDEEITTKIKSFPSNNKEHYKHKLPREQ